MSLIGTKRTFKVLRRRSDVEGRADMARTLPEGDPRYATDFLPSMDGAGCPPGGGGVRFMVALAAPLPGTTYAGTRWSTLAYVEKVRTQFLSLHQETLQEIHPVSFGSEKKVDVAGHQVGGSFWGCRPARRKRAPEFC